MQELAGFSLANAFFAVGAGLVSIASPCVLPVLPIVMAGQPGEHRLRPVAIVSGLMATFVLMGVLTSLFGAVVGPLLVRLEKPVGVLIGIVGLLVLLDLNPFKRLRVSLGSERGKGLGSGVLLGASLGLVWIPCVGPMLSGVLAMVATDGTLAAGVLLLLVYALGFAVPMLALGYGSQALRQRVRAVAARPLVVRWASGLLLVAFGAVILRTGMLFAGM